MAASELSPVVLPGSDGYWHSYEVGEALAERFPDQDASDLVYGAEYNDSGPLVEGAKVTHLKMLEQGENDGAEWVWSVTVDGITWLARGGCDYTGWDCQSHLAWTRVTADV